MTGIQDRIILLPKAKIEFIETKRPEINFRSFLSYLLFIMEPRKPLAISRPMVLVMVPSMESMPLSI